MNRTTSKRFRDLCISVYPKLGDNSSYWRMLGYLLFGTWIDRDTGLLIIGGPALSRIEDKYDAFLNNHYHSQNFLYAFRRDIQDFEILPWSHDTGKYRMVKNISFPQAIIEAKRIELEGGWANDEKVYFHDGTKRTPEKEIFHRKKEEAYAETLNMNTECLLTKALISYMNALPVNKFNRVLKYLPEARAHAKTLKDAEHQLAILKNIEDMCKPLYKGVHKSNRAFGIGENITNLHGDLRRILTQEWIELDLKASQLLICAKLWDIPEVVQFVRENRSIWSELCEHFGLDYHYDTKHVLKEAVYATLFGDKKWKIGKELSEKLGFPYDCTDLFFSYPLMNVLYDARERRKDRIRKEGGITDCFGNFLPLGNTVQRNKKSVVVDGSGYEMKNLLAQEAQSAELKMLYPIVDLAHRVKDDQHGFTILLWQHDGFSFQPNRKDEANKWIDRMKKLVKVSAAEVGVETELIVK